MKLYVRYFNKETLVSNADEVIDFLKNIPEIPFTLQLEDDIREYVRSVNNYPKRYKVKPHIYFIIIKTTAKNMQEFKDHKSEPMKITVQPGRPMLLQHHHDGWYEGTLYFKRVETIPGTTKFQYADTRFVARCKATCGQECYDRIVDHLRERVDSRSQFPAAKGKNFKFKFLGKWK